jgi:hypothetical protein
MQNVISERRGFSFRRIFVNECNSSRHSPVGRSDNSPAIHRWGAEFYFETLVPEGRQK